MILLSAFLDIHIQVKLVTIFTIFEGWTNSYLEWLHHLTLPLALQKGFNVPTSTTKGPTSTTTARLLLMLS